MKSNKATQSMVLLSSAIALLTTAHSAWADPAVSAVDSATRSDSKTREIKLDLEPGEVEQNKGQVRIEAGLLQKQTASGTRSGNSASVSARTEFGFKVDKEGETRTYVLDTDLGVDAHIERTKDDTSNEGMKTTRLDLNAPSVAIVRVRDGQDTRKASKPSTFDMKLAESGYAYSDDQVLKVKSNAYVGSLLNISAHASGTLNGIPIEIFGGFNPGQLLAGEIEIQGQKTNVAYAGNASFGSGFKLGQHVSVRNTTALNILVGGGHDELDQRFFSVERGLSNTTKVAVNLGVVKPYVGYQYSLEHSENSANSATETVQSHQAFLGVGAF